MLVPIRVGANINPGPYVEKMTPARISWSFGFFAEIYSLEHAESKLCHYFLTLVTSFLCK